MPLLTVQRLSKTIGARPLFREASLGVEEGERVGFIGANGAGKSTLFRILAGVEAPDSGTLALRRGATVGYLEQEPEFTSGASIFGAVSAGRPQMVHALEEFREVTSRIASLTASEASHLLALQGELSARIDSLGGWGWQHEVETVLTRLGVVGWDRSVDDLSGGERKRVALARVLLERPDLLLLDEPTNHLDADTALWLEDHLLQYPGAVLLVTHDRYFLDRVVDRMVEIEDASFTTFTGGYTEYLEARAERAGNRASEAARRNRLMERELAWLKRSPAARTGKQKARIQRLDRMRAEASAAPVPSAEPDIRFGPPPRLGRTVLDLESVTKAYDGRTLVEGLSLRMRAGERVGVIGPNGAGKTTLLRIVMGLEQPDSGVVRFGVNTVAAYYDQARADLDPTLSVYEAVGGEDWVQYSGRRVHVRSYLESFLFPTRTHEQRVGTLSGGERNRLLLARLLLREANLLLLDEPTNDLDLQTLQVLESALLEFGGSVLVVTHDRYFLDKVATGLLVFEDGGVVRRHEGGYDLYRRLRESEREGQPATEPHVRRARTRSAGGVGERPRRLTFRERKELEGIEGLIIAAESRRDELGAELSNPALYAETPEKVASLRTAFEDATREVETLYARWAELEEVAAAG